MSSSICDIARDITFHRRRALLVALALSGALLAGLVTPPLTDGTPAVRLQDEPDLAEVIAAVRATLPPEALAPVHTVRFTPADGSELVHGRGACGESWIDHGEIRIRRSPDCLRGLSHILYHEYRHWLDWSTIHAETGRRWGASWRPGCEEASTTPGFCPREAEEFAERFAGGYEWWRRTP